MTPSRPRKDLDAVLSAVGQFGRYQSRTYVLLAVPVMLSAIYVMTYVFTAGNVDYRCLVPECEHRPATYGRLPPAFATPWDATHDRPRRCERFLPRDDVTANASAGCVPERFNRETVPCTAYVMDDSEVTIANEWSIVCDAQWQLTTVGTVSNLGQFLGQPLAGYFSDKYGRKLTVVLSTVLSSLLGLARSLSVNYGMFVALEMAEPMVGNGMYAAAYLLSLEVVGPDRRVLGAAIVSALYALGESLLGVAALLVPNWRRLLRVLYVPGLLVGAYYWLLPESVRWLVSQQRTREARQVLMAMARMNRTKIPEDLLEDFLVEDAGNTPLGQVASTCDNPQEATSHEAPRDTSPSVTMGQVLRSRVLLVRLLNCCFCWMSTSFVYYGLSLFSVSLGGHKHVTFILVCLIELPAYVIMGGAADRLGRRWTLGGGLVVSGVSCLCLLGVTAVTDAPPWASLAPYLCGKLSVTAAFATLYLHTAELFPTGVRQGVLGLCAMCGRVATLAAPQAPLLAAYVPSLPAILFAALSLGAGVLSLLLPETVRGRLPDSVGAAEELGR